MRGNKPKRPLRGKCPECGGARYVTRYEKSPERLTPEKPAGIVYCPLCEGEGELKITPAAPPRPQPPPNTQVSRSGTVRPKPPAAKDVPDGGAWLPPMPRWWGTPPDPRWSNLWNWFA